MLSRLRWEGWSGFIGIWLLFKILSGFSWSLSWFWSRATSSLLSSLLPSSTAGVSKLVAREGHMRWDEHLRGLGVSKKGTHSFFRIRPAARSTREKKKELSCWIVNMMNVNANEVLLLMFKIFSCRPKTLYTHIQLHIYIMSMVTIQLLLYSLLWSVPRAGFEKKSQYIFLRHREDAGRIRFINLNQAAGRTKFCRGPDLARGPDFGHACSTETAFKVKEGRLTRFPSNLATHQDSCQDSCDPHHDYRCDSHHDSWIDSHPACRIYYSLPLLKSPSMWNGQGWGLTIQLINEILFRILVEILIMILVIILVEVLVQLVSDLGGRYSSGTGLSSWDGSGTASAAKRAHAPTLVAATAHETALVAETFDERFWTLKPPTTWITPTLPLATLATRFIRFSGGKALTLCSFCWKWGTPFRLRSSMLCCSFPWQQWWLLFASSSGTFHECFFSSAAVHHYGCHGCLHCCSHHLHGRCCHLHSWRHHLGGQHHHHCDWHCHLCGCCYHLHSCRHCLDRPCLPSSSPSDKIQACHLLSYLKVENSDVLVFPNAKAIFQLNFIKLCWTANEKT